MENKSLYKKPEGWGPKPQLRAMVSENVDVNKARIEAKIAEMKEALEVKYKNK